MTSREKACRLAPATLSIAGLMTIQAVLAIVVVGLWAPRRAEGYSVLAHEASVEA